MHDFFEKKGVLCEDFTNISEIFKKLNKSDFDFYIVDVNLHDENGIELLKELRKKNPHIPVIMVSAHTDIKTVMDAYEAG